MRKQWLAMVLALPIVVLMTVAAQTQSTNATHAALERLNVVRSEDGISVEFTARGGVTPKLSTLASPARVVIDLPNTVALDQHAIAVGEDGVKGVRVGMNGQTPPTTRVVVDLERACPYELVPGSDHQFAVRLHSGAAVAKRSPAAVTAPVAEPKVVAASQPVAAAPSAPAPSGTAAKPANDYVFLEPSY